jgi:hypothetical protein
VIKDKHACPKYHSERAKITNVSDFVLEHEHAKLKESEAQPLAYAKALELLQISKTRTRNSPNASHLSPDSIM